MWRRKEEEEEEEEEEAGDGVPTQKSEVELKSKFPCGDAPPGWHQPSRPSGATYGHEEDSGHQLSLSPGAHPPATRAMKQHLA